ncbi:hypothetical protein BLNAU_8138 [Blattamonas nauphoetae]|uniref:Tail specific protease domain-containing protein n=1 Tax=Blattamonas nauphoetae TaxID=2049346 RepID=A0ABQ9XZG4_9EUKA|nr:hypothetical protein BLNAU_8138 [Blattamonas nauphoetae]
MLVLLLRIVPFIYGASVCGFSKMDVVSYKEGRNCIQSIKISEESNEVNGTISIIKSYLQNNAYTDLYLSPPEPFKQYKADILADLETLKTQQFLTTYDFYSSVSSVLKSAKDPNLRLTRPCGDFLAFVLPFGLHAENSGSKTKLYLSMLPTQFKSVFEQSGLSRTKYENREILGISETGSSTDLAMDPVEYLISWAESNVFISRTEAGQFNRAVQRDFAIRIQDNYDIPPRDKVTFILKDGSDKEVVEFDWYLITETNIQRNNLQFHCKLSATNEAQEQNDIALSTRSSIEHLFMSKPELPSNADPQTGLLAFIFDHKGKPYGFLRIQTFDPDDGVVYQFVKEIMDYMDDFEKEKIEGLIIDLRSNTHAKTELALRTMQYIFGKQFPLFPEMDVRQSAIHTILHKSKLLTKTPYYRFRSATNITTSWYDTTQTKIVAAGSKRQSVKYSQRYTKYNDASELNFTQYYDYYDKNIHQHFPPHKVFILTDGLCANATGLIVKQIQETKLARVVGLGQTGENVVFDIATGPSAKVMSSVEIEKIKKDNPSNKLVQTIPGPFPRNDVQLLWTVEEAYSFDRENRKKTETGADLLEFIVHEPDHIVQQFPRYNEYTGQKLIKLAQDIAQLFTVCVPWNAIENSTCKSGTVAGDPLKKVKNAIYGNPCNDDGKGFNTSSCVFIRCKEDYFLDTDDVCKKVPILSTSLYAWEVIVPILLLVLIVGVLAGGLTLYWKKLAHPKATKTEDYQQIFEKEENKELGFNGETGTSFLDSATDV